MDAHERVKFGDVWPEAELEVAGPVRPHLAS